ncbi:restriction endonuclease subunit S [Desulfosporosinus sp. FKB]|uniref:restriction endonuclease subunit S n=1 Tax=Desulfosporosinus sp. FKB TaxID=1969835 RepID=UPI001A9A63C8|nr:restriction endonuclease subunit S [Desulfosporosinus sp. FKB]
MLSLNDKRWESFFISGDEGIFHIEATQSGIDKNKLFFDGASEIPYVTRSASSNGINMFIPSVQPDKYAIDSGNCITIGLDTQTVFYQPHDFYTGQNIQVLNYDDMNRNSALFVSAMLKVQMEKFNWGGNGATLGRLSRTKIMLPVNDFGSPDYKFMDDYIKDRINQKQEQCVKYCKKQLRLLGEQVSIPKTSAIDWQPFYINSIFDKPKRGKRIVDKNHISGNTPLVSSYGQENGVTHFIGNEDKVRKFNVCLSIANGGSSAGKTFYHPYTFVAADHVTQCWNRNLNQYQYLFLATVMTKALTGKYSFSHEISDPRLAKERIMLPATDSGEPDYKYMEQYIKNMMIKKYNSYLNNLKQN